MVRRPEHLQNGHPDPDVRFEKVSICDLGTLSGTVTDASLGDPLEGAQVTADGASDLSDSSGFYELALCGGSYDVTASAFGYASVTQSGVTIVEGMETVVDFALDSALTAMLVGTTDYGGTVSTLVEIDPATGATLRTIGPVGYAVNGLEYDATTGKLYGSTSVRDSSYNGLIEIDLATGAGTAIGVDGWGLSSSAAVTNITVDSTGQMFGWWDPSQDDLVRIDKATGVAIRVGNSGLSTARNGLDFDISDVLYMVNYDGRIYTVSPLTGVASYIRSMGITAHHGDFDPSSDLYYGISSISSSRSLVVADFATGSVIDLLPALADNVHTLTFVSDRVELRLEPEFDFNLIDTQHTLTATLTEGPNPVSGSEVTFEVLAGPNAADGGVDTTDVNGEATFAYTGDGGAGVDEIEAWAVDDVGDTVESNVALKFWDEDCQDPPNNIPDTCDIGCDGFDGFCSEFAGCGGSADDDGNGVPDECILPTVVSYGVEGGLPHIATLNGTPVRPVDAVDVSRRRARLREPSPTSSSKTSTRST